MLCRRRRRCRRRAAARRTFAESSCAAAAASVRRLHPAWLLLAHPPALVVAVHVTLAELVEDFLLCAEQVGLIVGGKAIGRPPVLGALVTLKNGDGDGVSLRDNHCAERQLLHQERIFVSPQS